MTYKSLATLIKEHHVPKYQCTKQVHALRITKREGLKLFIEGHTDPIEVEPSMVSRFLPDVGDYVVIYKDGYVSFSPAHVFEDGYTRIAE